METTYEHSQSVNYLSRFCPQLPSISRESILEYSKTAGKGIAILGAGAIAYTCPFLYTLGFTATVITTACVATSALFNKKISAETLNKIISVSLMILAVGGLGMTVGFVPTLAKGIVWSVKAKAIVPLLFCSSLASGFVGTMPFFNDIYNKYSSQLFNGPSQNLRNWVNQPARETGSLDFIERMELFFALGFPNLRPHLSVKAQSTLLSMEMGDAEYEDFLKVFTMIAQYGSAEEKRFAKTLWPILSNYVTSLTGETKDRKLMELIEYFEKWNTQSEFFRRFYDNRGLVNPDSGLVSSESINQFFRANTENYQRLYDSFVEKITEFDFGTTFREITREIDRLRVEQRPDPNDVAALKSDVNDLRKKLTLLGKESALWHKAIIKDWWVISDSTAVKEATLFGLTTGITLYNDALISLTSQTTQGTSLWDKMQLLVNRTRANDNLDKGDSVWNFLLTECGVSFQALETMTGKIGPQSIDAFFEEIQIPSVEDLLTQNIVTDQDLTDRVETKEKIIRNIETFIADHNSRDVRSSVYTALGLSSVSSKVFPILQKVDNVTAPIFYRFIMAFTIMAPVINRPVQAAVGAVFGVVSSLIEHIPYVKELNEYGRWFVDEVISRRIPVSFFTRRSFLLNDAGSQRDARIFLNSDVFGRIRLFSFETFVGFSTCVAAFGHGGEIEVGGLFQGFCLGREAMDMVTGQFQRLVWNRV